MVNAKINLNHAKRQAYALDDHELVKSLKSAQICWNFYIRTENANQAQFQQFLYWSIRAEIARRWK